MTTETTTEASAAPATPVETDAHEDAVSLATQLLAGEPAPEQPPATPSPPGEPAQQQQQQQGDDLPGLDEIERIARERQEQAAARSREQAPLEAIAALQAKIDAITANSLTPATLQDPAKAIEALAAAGLDPDALIASLARHRLQQGKVATPGLSAVEQQLQALSAKLDALASPPKPEPAGPPSPEQLEQIQGAFGEYVKGAAQLYPKASALPPAAIGVLGWDYVARMAKAGYDTTKVTDAQIAAAIEKTLTGSSVSPLPADGGTQPLTGVQQPPAAHGGNTTTPSAVRSLSPGLAAEGTRTPPQDEDDVFEDVVTFAASLLKGA